MKERSIPVDKEKRRSAYMEKLRDPRWQKMRLKIMERDYFACRYCGDEESTLNVHHLDYKAGNDPWDYPEDWLVTLCETCHEEERQNRPIDERSLLHVLRICGFTCSQLTELLIAFDRAGQMAEPMFSGLCWAIENPEIRSELEDLRFQYLKNRRSSEQKVPTP